MFVLASACGLHVLLLLVVGLVFLAVMRGVVMGRAAATALR